jgi:hypothetical protein
MLETSLTMAVAVSVSLLSLFDVVDDGIVSATTLAVLSLLAFDRLNNAQQMRKVNHRVHDRSLLAGRATVESPVQFALTEATTVRTALDGGRDIRLLGVTLNRTIRNNLGLLERQLAVGASVRVALIAPDGPVPAEAARRNGTAQEEAHVFVNRLRSTVDSLRYLSGLPNVDGRLEVRFLDFVPAFGLMIVAQGAEEQSLTVDVYSHGPTAPEATIVIRPAFNPELYRHFSEEFERIWRGGRPARVDHPADRRAAGDGSVADDHRPRAVRPITTPPTRGTGAGADDRLSRLRSRNGITNASESPTGKVFAGQRRGNVRK